MTGNPAIMTEDVIFTKFWEELVHLFIEVNFLEQFSKPRNERDTQAERTAWPKAWRGSMSEYPGYRGQLIAARAWQAAGARGARHETDCRGSTSWSYALLLSMRRVTKSSDCWGRRGFGTQGGATCSGSHSLSPGSFQGSALTVISHPTLGHSYLVLLPTQETSRFGGNFRSDYISA